MCLEDQYSLVWGSLRLSVIFRQTSDMELTSIHSAWSTDISRWSVSILDLHDVTTPRDTRPNTTGSRRTQYRKRKPEVVAVTSRMRRVVEVETTHFRLSSADNNRERGRQPLVTPTTIWYHTDVATTSAGLPPDHFPPATLLLRPP